MSKGQTIKQCILIGEPITKDYENSSVLITTYAGFHQVRANSSH